MNWGRPVEFGCSAGGHSSFTAALRLKRSLLSAQVSQTHRPAGPQVRQLTLYFILKKRQLVCTNPILPTMRGLKLIENVEEKTLQNLSLPWRAP